MGEKVPSTLFETMHVHFSTCFTYFFKVAFKEFFYLRTIVSLMFQSLMCVEGERYAELLSIFKVEFYLRFQVHISQGLSVSV